MRTTRKKVGAVLAAGALALTMSTALPIHAAAVSIWPDYEDSLFVPEDSLWAFDYENYAARYPDVKALYGHDREALYDHYETIGKAEGRTAYFEEPWLGVPVDDGTTWEWVADSPLDPLPPLAASKLPDWFDDRTFVDKMSNARLVAEYNQLEPFLVQNDWWWESTMIREKELLGEMSKRVKDYENLRGSVSYLHAINKDINLLYQCLG